MGAAQTRLVLLCDRARLGDLLTPGLFFWSARSGGRGVLLAAAGKSAFLGQIWPVFFVPWLLSWVDPCDRDIDVRRLLVLRVSLGQA